MTGFIVWFTGLSGSGKSTLATLVKERITARGLRTEILDGDEVRRNLSRGLGFSKEDRDENLRRLGFVARVVARTGACAIAAAISPYRAVRDEQRRESGRFCEVYCECPIPVLTARDPKGLYEKAIRGELKNFTGINDPYEAPLAPDVHVYTDRETPEESADRIVAKLQELGYLDVKSGAATTTRVAHTARRSLDSTETRALVASLPTLTLDDEQAELAEWLGLGLLAPVQGFMTTREAYCVEREQRLETGGSWPSVIALESRGIVEDGVRRAARLVLEDARGRSLGLLDVDEAVPNGGGVRFAGRVKLLASVDARPATDAALDQLAELEPNNLLAIDARHGAGALDSLLPAALTLFDAVLLLGSTNMNAEATPDRVVRLTLPEGLARALAPVVAHNCGATHWLATDSESDSAARRQGLTVLSGHLSSQKS